MKEFFMHFFSKTASHLECLILKLWVHIELTSTKCLQNDE